MKVLVACEESQRVCIAFRNKGHEAYSCDIQECSGGHPEWHIQDDVLNHLDKNWDLIIAHPPCTYLSNAGARFLYPKGILNEERLKKGLEAKEMNNDIAKKCFKLEKENKELKEKVNSYICSTNCYKHKETDKYRQALQEIKEIAEETSKIYPTKTLSQILQKCEVLDDK